MNPHPKKVSGERNANYLKYVRAKGCVVHPKRDADAHHLRCRGMGGHGQKSDDWQTVGLCRECHTTVGQGAAWYEDLYGINLWEEAHRLLMEYMKENWNDR